MHGKITSYVTVYDVCIESIVCTVSVVVVVDAELEKTSFDEVTLAQYQDRIVSQSRSALPVDSLDQVQHRRDKLDENLRSLGSETRLVLLSSAEGIALYFLCMTLSAIVSLRDQWRNGQLRRTVESLFNVFLDNTQKVRVERLTWALSDYERCLDFFGTVNGK